MAFVQQPPDDMTLNKYSLEYPYAELQQATQNFDARCRLGSGAFGAVYRGIQQDGTEVAVKVLDMPLEAGFEEEVRVLSKFRHPNLVILMGFARCGPQRFLVYELLEGGDVYRRLQRSNSEGIPFLWNQRISAAFDAACGLSHLHNATPKVFHRDIKSANILLNRNGTAKMADFGLACLSDAKEHKVKSAAGTVGYACPIYAKRSVVTEGSEVYSFGVVLLELLTASPSAWIINDSKGSQRYQFLVSHMQGDLCTAMSFVDPDAQWPQQVACVIVDVALRCTQHDEAQRPCFSEIVNVLRRHLHGKEPNPRAMHKVRSRPELQAPPRLRSPAPQPVQSQAFRQLIRENSGPRQALLCQQPAPMTVLHGLPAAPRVSPPLWSLECTFSEGLASVASIPREQRTIVHRPESGTPMLAAFTVGRRTHEDFFNSMVFREENRTAVSREHFQIWATQVFYTNAPPIETALQNVPCAFFLANLSRTWTTVNGALLDGCGKTARLHHGDCIAVGRTVQTPACVRYEPFLQFCFDLSGSLLQDEEVPEALDLSGGQASECEGLTMLTPPSASVRKGTPLAGDVVPLFLLRLEGRGVRAGPSSEGRVIVHGPLLDAPNGPAFAPLVLGRGHHSWFWECALSNEALAALAWEHVVFEACGDECAGGVAVRSLDNGRKLRVGAGEGPRTLEPEEQRLLRHGDVVVLVPEQACSVWLSFHDLRASGPFKTCTIGVATPMRAAALARRS